MRSFSINAGESSLISLPFTFAVAAPMVISIVTFSSVLRFLPVMVTSSFSPFHSTFAPRFSATNLAGSIVRSFSIFGATSFDFDLPNTCASFLPIVKII